MSPFAPGLPVCYRAQVEIFRSWKARMDSDRKYKQSGYNQDNRSPNNNGDGFKSKPQGLRPPLDITGPRLPRLVQSVTASRCYSCSTTLQPGTDFIGTCPKCACALHVCKQCSHFEPSTRFQCLKPIPLRIPSKDQANSCTLFAPRVTVSRDGTNASNGNGMPPKPPAPSMSTAAPRNANDARDAFARLFKK